MIRLNWLFIVKVVIMEDFIVFAPIADGIREIMLV